MDDRLHQPYRAALIPRMSEAITAGYAANALGVALSEAGPALMAFARGGADTIATALCHAFAQHGITCQTRLLTADTTGAVAVETSDGV
jgi:homoserine kinase